MGLITRIVPAADLLAAAWEVAADLARNGAAVAYIKAAVRGGLDLSLAAGCGGNGGWRGWVGKGSKGLETG